MNIKACLHYAPAYFKAITSGMLLLTTSRIKFAALIFLKMPNATCPKMSSLHTVLCNSTLTQTFQHRYDATLVTLAQCGPDKAEFSWSYYENSCNLIGTLQATVYFIQSPNRFPHDFHFGFAFIFYINV